LTFIYFISNKRISLTKFIIEKKKEEDMKRREEEKKKKEEEESRFKSIYY
jgi:hypothetical protein